MHFTAAATGRVLSPEQTWRCYLFTFFLSVRADNKESKHTNQEADWGEESLLRFEPDFHPSPARILLSFFIFIFYFLRVLVGVALCVAEGYGVGSVYVWN